MTKTLLRRYIGCGKCLKVCPQNCIDKIESEYTIRQNNCLHCGACFENCPEGAVIRL
ncbi:MAG: 4Fe-4S binding protein [Ruminococcus sp.]|nr:4Fe-4S binding protein [Ruminococcus sp.]